MRCLLALYAQPVAAQSNPSNSDIKLYSPIRLHLDVLAEHVEADGFASLNVILQPRITGRCEDAIWPVALHTHSEVD